MWFQWIFFCCTSSIAQHIILILLMNQMECWLWFSMNKHIRNNMIRLHLNFKQNRRTALNWLLRLTTHNCLTFLRNGLRKKKWIPSFNFPIMWIYNVSSYTHTHIDYIWLIPSPKLLMNGFITIQYVEYCLLRLRQCNCS